MQQFYTWAGDPQLKMPEDIGDAWFFFSVFHYLSKCLTTNQGSMLVIMALSVSDAGRIVLWPYFTVLWLLQEFLPMMPNCNRKCLLGSFNTWVRGCQPNYDIQVRNQRMKGIKIVKERSVS